MAILIQLLGVNGCLSLYVGPVESWRTVQAVAHHPPRAIVHHPTQAVAHHPTQAVALLSVSYLTNAFWFLVEAVS